MPRRKVLIGKFDNIIGSVELTETGGFRFDGPQADFLQRGMEEFRIRSGARGEEAFTRFLRNTFAGSSYWMRDVE